MSPQQTSDAPRIAAAFNWDADPSKAERALPNLGEADISTLVHFGRYGVSPDQYGRDWFAERIEHLCSKHDITVWVVFDRDGPDHPRSLGSPEPLLPRTAHQLIAPSESIELLTWLLQRNPEAGNQEVVIINVADSGLDLSWLMAASDGAN